MKPVEAHFLDDICAAPADRAVRLIYADWLDEHRSDNPVSADRASFIRLQCQAEAFDPGDRRALSLQAEAATLLRQHAQHWTPPLPRAAKYEFRGGFVEAITLDSQTLTARLNKILRRCPLRSVKLTEGAAWRLFLASPLPDQLGELDIAECFISYPTQSGMIEPLIENWMRLLMWGPAWPGLRKLVLDGNTLWPGQLRQVITRDQMPALESLSLLRGELTFHEARTLADSSLPARLREFALTVDVPEHDAGPVVEEFFSAPWTDLRSFTLDGIERRPEVLGTLARAPWLARLKTLRLLGAASVDAVLGSPVLEDHVHELEIVHGISGRADPAWLAQQPWLHGLKSLRLVHSPAADPLARALTLTPTPPALDRLCLTGQSFWSAGGASFVAEIIQRTSPATLQITHCGSARDLVASPALRTVRSLHLGNCDLVADSARALLESAHLDGLVALDLRGNPIPPAWRERLRERFPFVELDS
jgi:uncharacterized protein (TIGR02996 family)